jgi:hypothetical protein
MAPSQASTADGAGAHFPLVAGSSRTRLKSHAHPSDHDHVIKLGRKPARQQEKYRLVTRSDFDGLVCAALLKELDMLDDILFVHPKDMQDGKIEICPTSQAPTSRSTITRARPSASRTASRTT